MTTNQEKKTGKNSAGKNQKKGVKGDIILHAFTRDNDGRQAIATMKGWIKNGKAGTEIAPRFSALFRGTGITGEKIASILTSGASTFGAHPVVSKNQIPGIAKSAENADVATTLTKLAFTAIAIPSIGEMCVKKGIKSPMKAAGTVAKIITKAINADTADMVKPITKDVKNARRMKTTAKTAKKTVNTRTTTPKNGTVTTEIAIN